MCSTWPDMSRAVTGVEAKWKRRAVKPTVGRITLPDARAVSSVPSASTDRRRRCRLDISTSRSTTVVFPPLSVPMTSTQTRRVRGPMEAAEGGRPVRRGTAAVGKLSAAGRLLPVRPGGRPAWNDSGWPGRSTSLLSATVAVETTSGWHDNVTRGGPAKTRISPDARRLDTAHYGPGRTVDAFIARQRRTVMPRRTGGRATSPRRRSTYPLSSPFAVRRVKHK